MAKISCQFLWVRKTIAVLLLSIFAFGITPVILLHDAFADHHDICYHHFDAEGKQLSKADVSCINITFVAEAQFLSFFKSVVVAAPERMLTCCSNDKILTFYSRHPFFSELRGPPCLPHFS